MPSETVKSRYLYLVAAIVMQLCLGNLYTWSVFRTPLMELHGWTVRQATLPFTLSVVFFAVGMVVAGRWQDRVGPRRVGMTGAALLGAGLLLASWLGSRLPGLYLSYGVLGGLGVGFAYVTPIATVVKWFPDMRGLMTGVSVLGFGAGSLIGAPLSTMLIQALGVHETFAALGMVLGLLVVASSGRSRIHPKALGLEVGSHRPSRAALAPSTTPGKC